MRTDIDEYRVSAPGWTGRQTDGRTDNDDSIASRGKKRRD